MYGFNGIVARNFNARVSNGSTSYTGGSSSSESESYLHLSDFSPCSGGGVTMPLRSIHNRFSRPIRRRNEGWLPLEGSLDPAENWKTGASRLSTCVASGMCVSTSISDEVEAGGVIKYCVFACRNLTSVPCSLTGESGSPVRSIWLWFHFRWFWTFISMSSRSSFSFSASLSDNKTRSASSVLPSDRTGCRKWAPVGCRITGGSAGLRF